MYLEDSDVPLIKYLGDDVVLRIGTQEFWEEQFVKFRVEYFEVTGASKLQLKWTTPISSVVSYFKPGDVYAECFSAPTPAPAPFINESLTMPPPVPPGPIQRALLYSEWVLVNQTWGTVNMPLATAGLTNPVVILSPATRLTLVSQVRSIEYWKYRGLLSDLKTDTLSLPPLPCVCVCVFFESQSLPAAVPRMKNLRKGLENGCQTQGYCFDIKLFPQACTENAGPQFVSYFAGDPGVYTFATTDDEELEDKVKLGCRIMSVYVFLQPEKERRREGEKRKKKRKRTDKRHVLMIWTA